MLLAHGANERDREEIKRMLTEKEIPHFLDGTFVGKQMASELVEMVYKKIFKPNISSSDFFLHIIRCDPFNSGIILGGFCNGLTFAGRFPQ